MKSTFVCNRENKQKYDRLTINLLPAGIRIETLEGREHVVVPMIILTEGVHTGSQGALLYNKEELNKTPAVWNHKPVVVYHPTMNGEGISACDPTVLDSRKVGIMLNTRFENGKLKSEAWLERDRANKVDPRIMESVDSATMMELSTGVFIDVDDAPGKWNKEDYVGIARNFRPDHLALLPDQEGACSIKDGAGFIRNQQADKGFLEKLKTGLESLGIFVGNEMSSDTKSRMLADALTKKHFPSSDTSKYGPTIYPKAVYSNFVVYPHPQTGKLFKQGYKANKNSVKLTDESPEEVDQVTEFRTKDGSFIGNEVANSSKDDDSASVVDKDLDILRLVGNFAKGKGYGGFLVKDAKGNGHLPTKKNGATDWGLVGAAWAALHEGHRGNKYAGPDKSGAIGRLTKIYERAGKTPPTQNQQNTMNKTKMIDAVINAKNGWEETDRETLEALTDAQLKLIHNAAVPPVENEDGDEEEDKGAVENAGMPNKKMKGKKNAQKNKGGADTAADDDDDDPADDEDDDEDDKPAKNTSVQEYIDAAPPEVREVLLNSVSVLNEEKIALVKVITANKNNGFTKADLANKPLSELRNLARLASSEFSTRRIPRYEGQAPADNSAEEGAETPLEIPTLNFEAEGKPKKEAVGAK